MRAFWVLSPALTMEVSDYFTRRCGSPDAEWCMTKMSGFMAWSFLKVSMKASPFTMLLPLATLSSDSLFTALSKERRVRGS